MILSSFKRSRVLHWTSLESFVLMTRPKMGEFDLTVIRKHSGEIYLIQCRIVDTLKKAENMIQRFKANPPYGRHARQRYTQMLEVFVKEERQVIGGWV